MNDNPAITAVCNLLAALGASMMASGRPSDLRMLLSMFDNMNEATIQPGPALDKLKAASGAQRGVLEQMPR
jgi:hypothetical protein